MAIDAEILDRLTQQLPARMPRLDDLHIFTHWVIARCQRPAMSTLFREHCPDDTCCRNTYLGDHVGRPVAEIIADLAGSNDPLRMALCMACLNGSLPLPPDLFEANAMAPFEERIKRRRSCFIGHFHEAETWRAQGYPVTIVELQPRPGDVHWNDSKPALREAEMVFITGLTLLNDTFREVIDRTPKAVYRVLMGPTVPCSPVFFDYGVHLIGSTLIADAGLAIRYCQLGGTSVGKAPPGALRKVNLTNRPELTFADEQGGTRPCR